MVAPVVNRKATGTLLLHNLEPGKNLWLLSTGTGLAPFLSIIKDPTVYERFDRVILTHTVRNKNELVCGACVVVGRTRTAGGPRHSIVRAIEVVVLGRVGRHRFGHCTPGPPPADTAGKCADDRADGAT